MNASYYLNIFDLIFGWSEFVRILNLEMFLQDECGRNVEHAGTGEESGCAVFANEHQRGVRRSPAAPTGRDLLGKRQSNR